MNEQDRKSVIDAMHDEDPDVARDRRWARAVMACGVLAVWLAVIIEWLGR